MKSLIWKECRLNSWVLALGIVLGLGPYLAGLLWFLLGGGPRVGAGMRLAFGLEPASVISTEGTMLILLLLGANAIARERADRSAEFLAYLPISRARVLASKAAVPLAVASAVWALALAAHVLAPATSGGTVGGAMPPGLMRAVCAASILLFGSAWLGSSIVDTPMTAVGFALGVCMLLWSAFAASNQLFGWPAYRLSEEATSYWYAAAMGIVGTSCFLVGSWLYLRRVEP